MTLDTRETRLGMQVNFTPEQEAELSQIARHEGRNAEELAKDVLLRVIEHNQRHRAAVREGIAAAARGEFVEDKDVRLWLQERERS